MGTVEATDKEEPVPEEKVKSVQEPEHPPVTEPSVPKEDADMEGLTGAMTALRFVPPSVRFGGRGRGRGRGGFSRS